jgi:acyl dehydratase
MTSIIDSKEWQAATDYQLSDADIERAKFLLGYDSPLKFNEHLNTATQDAIRNYAWGIGNDNPLHSDPRYASTTRWGEVVGPPIMTLCMNSPMLGDPMPPEIKAANKSLFKGIHVFVSGGEWHFYRPVRIGDTVFCFDGQEALEVKNSEFAGRTVTRFRRFVKINQHADVIAVYRERAILAERKAAREKKKYVHEATVYSAEKIAEIDAMYEAEVRRGGEPRYWEDVQVGDSLGKKMKGPLTVTDIIAWHAGGYGFEPFGLRANRMAYLNRKRIPAFYIKNEQGIPDVGQRLHWDSAWAQAVGVPAAYDYGPLREANLYHYLSDWAGDDGWITRLYDEVRKFNYIGDLQVITGEVTAKREENGNSLVDVTFRFINQRDEETLRGDATIALPSKSKGPVVLPEPLSDLKRKAVAMMQRHWQLSSTTK